MNNRIPEEWSKHYKMDWNGKYVLKSRPWSFELSTVVQGQLIVLYSKLLSKKWPNYELLANRCKGLIDDLKEGMGVGELTAKYQTKLIVENKRENRFKSSVHRRALRNATSQGALLKTQEPPFKSKIKIESKLRMTHSSTSHSRQHNHSGDNAL